MKKRIYLFLALIFSACFLFAQTEDKTQLEKERQDIQKEIREIQGEYDKLKGKTKQIVGQYNLKRSICWVGYSITGFLTIG